MFEATNAELKEVYVTATPLPIFEAMARFAKNRPEAVAHWQADQHVSFRSLEFHLTKDEAAAFVQRHVAKRLPERWRYVLDGGESPSPRRKRP